MRLKIAIVLAVLGLLVLGTGIGQRTIWLPPATLSASVPAVTSPAPLTVIGSDLLKTRDSQFTLTIKGEGPIQLAVAREGDITGWIGDAAYTKVGGANEDFTALTSESVAGTETVPNPSGSDMWVSEEKATGELSYTWEAPGRGDWALLLSSDGTAPAPTDISISVDNEAGTPWAVPLMILGSVLLALAALLFLLAPRKPRNDEAVGGRRSAVRPADAATGALELAKIVAARESAKAASAPTPATIADVRRAETKAGAAGTGAPAKAAAADATSALPLSLRGGDAANADQNAKKPGVRDVPAKDSPSSTDVDSKDDTDSKNDADSKDNADSKNDADSDRGPDSGGGSGSGSGSGSKPDPGVKKDKLARWSASAKKKAAKSKEAGKDDGKSEFTAPAVQAAKRDMKLRTRWGAALAAVLLAGSVSPAIADVATTPAPTPVTTEEAPATPDAVAGFPNLLDSQVQRIASDVATVVASGDNAMNATELEPRVAGMALEVRTSNYRIRSAIEAHPAAEPVNATELLAKVVTTTETWPRSAMLVTKGENNELPQLLTLVQAGPRENYKLIKATPLLPGQTLPTVDREGTREVALEDATGLMMSPEAAVSALSDRLTKEDSEFTDSFKDSIYINSVFDLQNKVIADAADADLVFSHNANTDSIVSVRTADGGAMVVVGNTFSIDATSKEDATLTVSEDAAVFTGGTETTTGFALNYAEPVVMYIPPATGEDQITILSATRDLVGGTFK